MRGARVVDFIREKQGGVSRELVEYIEQLASYDASYFYALYQKFWEKGKPLKIGKNFFPSAFLTDSERRKKLGAVDYCQIKKDSSLAEVASQVNLICNPMDGGIGSSLSRSTYLRRIWKDLKRKGKPHLGTKGVDLYFDLEVFGRNRAGRKIKLKEKANITELKYLQAIKEASSYRKMIIEELVNKEGKDSIKEFLNETLNFWDRINHCPKKKNFSYQQLIEKKRKISLPDDFFSCRALPFLTGEPKMIVQSSLPAICKKSNMLTLKRLAPGGHGQLGYIVLKEAARLKFSLAKNLIRAIYNGDGLNNFPDEFMVGYLVKKRIPLALVSSTKSNIDKKGGQIGLFKDKGGRRPQIMEAAQAERAGQKNLFVKIGLEKAKEEKFGTTGKQYFNTNLALVNYSVLAPFLKDLVALIGEEEFLKIISPDLICNEKIQNGKAYIQLEGALASTFFNLAGFLATSPNSRIKSLVKKHKIDNFLAVINISEALRTRFFTPVKFAWDFWLYAYSDHFKINTKTFKLENLRPGHLPVFDLKSYFYHDLENCIKAFGRASTIGLESLVIQGEILIKDAKLSGRVSLQNKGNHLIDLNHPDFKDYLEKENGRLILKNTKITINPDRKIKREKF